ncbi:MAG: hypothetical protein JSU07_12845 [Bacteroidetes bacterium]|nr:hypothetical protein [Bacteroidota bacterium]
MKNFILIFILLTSLSLLSKTETLVVEGKYQNKNIFVQNSFGTGGIGFCAQEVKVNGKITTDETNSSAFEIDLASLQLKMGEKIIIEILHKDGCTPRVLNMEDLKPKPTFEVLTIAVSPAGVLKWNTKNESGALPYIVEQYKWNKWIPIGEVDGIGTSDNHEYSFQVTMHSGENKYRVKQKGLNSISKASPEATVSSKIEKPTFVIAKAGGEMDFSSETAYEIYDNYGVVVKKGFGKTINIGNLSKSNYYLCFDNSVTEFKK